MDAGLEPTLSRTSRKLSEMPIHSAHDTDLKREQLGLLRKHHSVALEGQCGIFDDVQPEIVSTVRKTVGFREEVGENWIGDLLVILPVIPPSQNHVRSDCESMGGRVSVWAKSVENVRVAQQEVFLVVPEGHRAQDKASPLW